MNLSLSLFNQWKLDLLIPRLSIHKTMLCKLFTPSILSIFSNNKPLISTFKPNSNNYHQPSSLSRQSPLILSTIVKRYQTYGRSYSQPSLSKLPSSGTMARFIIQVLLECSTPSRRISAFHLCDTRSTPLCQKIKGRFPKLGHLPPKSNEINSWEEVKVDLVGPWIFFKVNSILSLSFYV